MDGREKNSVVDRLTGGSFWTYQKSKEVIGVDENASGSGAKIMLCGGVAGVATWASIYPLDVVKTRIQGADLLCNATARNTSAAGPATLSRRADTWRTVRTLFREGGTGVFFRGLGACSVRAFLVNAVQVSYKDAPEKVLTQLVVYL